MISPCTHHKYDGEEDAGCEHHGEAVEEPGHPVHAVAETHHAHRLLQPHLLLVDDRLDDHRGGVDPGQGHEQGEGTCDGDYEPDNVDDDKDSGNRDIDGPVLDVAGIGHLLDADAGDVGDVPASVLGDDGVLHHVLEEETLSDRPVCPTWR